VYHSRPYVGGLAVTGTSVMTLAECVKAFDPILATKAFRTEQQLLGLPLSIEEKENLDSDKERLQKEFYHTMKNVRLVSSTELQLLDEYVILCGRTIYDLGEIEFDSETNETLVSGTMLPVSNKGLVVNMYSPGKEGTVFRNRRMDTSALVQDLDELGIPIERRQLVRRDATYALDLKYQYEDLSSETPVVVTTLPFVTSDDGDRRFVIEINSGRTLDTKIKDDPLRNEQGNQLYKIPVIIRGHGGGW